MSRSTGTRRLRTLLVALATAGALAVPAVASAAVSLGFSQAVGGTVADKDGQGTGFTAVQPNTGGTQYDPGAIDLDTTTGRLTITAQTGSTGTTNNARNVLYVPFDGRGDETVSARLVGSLSGLSAQPQQGGVYIGPSQNDYVKLVATRLDSNDTNILQFYYEIDGVGGQQATVTPPNWGTIEALDLYLVMNGATGQVRAEYSIDGGPRTQVGSTYTVPAGKRTAFFNQNSQGGVLAFTGNVNQPVPVQFDRFQVGECVAAGGRPSVASTSPAGGATGVPRSTAVTAEVNLPNCGGIDREAVDSGAVRLFDTTTNSQVPAVVNTSGGGDVIVLQPTVILASNRTYRFEVTDGLEDLSGAAFQPWSSTFTTGTGTGGGGGNFSGGFTRSVTSAPLLTGGVGYTSVVVGPDGKLYAGMNTGEIKRFTINADGSLGAQQQITTVQNHEGGPRILVGMAFDPASTAANPILWVTHNEFAFSNATEWSGKISRLTGPNLGTIQDVVVNLPRSARDHLTNSLAFHNGALYLTQGSNSATGAPDNGWNQRPERLLNASVLRLDPAKLPASLPLDVKTPDGGGTYNPYAPNAALTLFGTGIRNAYDLVWHTNGQLYVPTNGSAAGGNTPATDSPLPASCSPRADGPWTGPSVPAITNPGAQADYLYRVTQGGYYGHPNPTRCEWVLNGGNPTSGNDPLEVPKYPVGTQPDRNFRGAAFNFGLHFSPNGVIEYQGGAFAGALDGTLLVVRYSAGDDIIALTPNGSNGDIATSQTGITGLTGLVNPLDLTEDLKTGNLYIVEYPDPSKTTAPSRIVLAKPIGGADSTPPSVTGTAPAAGATGVPVNSNVAAAFSEGLAPATVSTATVTLAPAGGAPVAATVSLSDRNRTVTIDPAADLAPATTYTATVSNGVTDVAGNGLAAPATWSFTTAGGPGAGAGGAIPPVTPPVKVAKPKFTATGLKAVWNRKKGVLTLTVKGRDKRSTVKVGARYIAPNKKGVIVLPRRKAGTIVIRVQPTPLSRGILTARTWKVTLKAKGAPKVLRIGR